MSKQTTASNKIYISRKQQVFISACLVAILGGLFGVFALVGYALDAPKVADYTQCTKANGSTLQESYPEICVTKDGQRFQNPDAVAPFK